MAPMHPSAIPEVIADATLIGRKRDRSALTAVPGYDHPRGLGPTC
jgi:hypothetical protein